MTELHEMLESWFEAQDHEDSQGSGLLPFLSQELTARRLPPTSPQAVSPQTHGPRGYPMADN